MSGGGDKREEVNVMTECYRRSRYGLGMGRGVGGEGRYTMVTRLMFYVL